MSCAIWSQQSRHPHLAHPSAAGVEHRAPHRQQLLHEEPEAHSVCGGDQHLEEGLLDVVGERRDDGLPGLQGAFLEVHVHAPKSLILRDLHDA